MQPVYIAPPPPGSESTTPAETAVPSSLGTEADRLRSQYKSLGEEQKHTYGDNPPGTKPIDFTKLGNPGAAPAPAPAAAGKTTAAPLVGPAPKPDAKKNTPTLPGAPAATPPTASPKPPTGGQSPSPVRNSPPPASTPPPTLPKPPTGGPSPNPDAKKNTPTLPAAHRPTILPMPHDV
jgi:hypothetical protein